MIILHRNKPPHDATKSIKLRRLSSYIDNDKTEGFDTHYEGPEPVIFPGATMQSTPGEKWHMSFHHNVDPFLFCMYYITPGKDGMSEKYGNNRYIVNIKELVTVIGDYIKTKEIPMKYRYLQLCTLHTSHNHQFHKILGRKKRCMITIRS